MRRILFSIGPVHVYTYGLMIAIGLVLACILLAHNAKKYGKNPDLAINLTLVCLIFGAIGTKLLYWITVLPDFIADPAYYLTHLSNGFVIYGGLIVGAVAGIVYLKKKDGDPFGYFDLAMPSVALGQCLGRIGCFFGGCCYGAPTDLPIGVIFPEGANDMAGIKVLPTQLFSSALNLINVGILCLFLAKKKNRAPGQCIGLYFITYSIGRFFIEFFRGDAERGSVGVLSTSQFIAILTFIAGILIYIAAGRIGKMKAAKVCEEAPEEVPSEVPAAEETVVEISEEG